MLALGLGLLTIFASVIHLYIFNKVTRGFTGSLEIFVPGPRRTRPGVKEYSSLGLGGLVHEPRRTRPWA